jgi:hypothetical protein
MNRRQFLGSIGLTTLAAPTVLKAGSPESPGLIKPPRLAPGDKIALVNPATAAFETSTSSSPFLWEWKSRSMPRRERFRCSSRGWFRDRMPAC